MFDDQPQTTGGITPPPNLPVEPEDIFADTEIIDPAAASATPKALSAGMLKPKVTPTASVMPKIEEPPMVFSDANYNTKSPIIGKVVIGIAVLAVIGGAAFGGWLLYGKFLSINTIPSKTGVVNKPPLVVSTVPVEPTVNMQPNTNIVVPESTPMAPTDTSSTVAQMQSDQLLFGERKDSDNDGLDDATEARLATDLKKTDSDGDKLCDGDEVLVWKTDPLKIDTDADKHVDGSEVYNGYNPIGPGKLGPLPDGVTTSTACQSAKK